MNIGGFQPLSLCDFPGTPAAVIFTQGCNWRCPYCHNSSLLPLKETGLQYDAGTVLRTLNERRKVLNGVVISGGEPTLQEDLISFLRELQAMGFAVKLDTNGSNPSIVQTLLSQNLVDYIAMDIKAPWDKYELLTGTGDVDIKAVQESIKLISAGGVKHHFRTTYALQFLKEDDIMAIRAGLPAGSPHIIQECNDG